ERLSVPGDAVDGVHQLAHGGNEGELCRLAGGAQPFVELAQPWVAPHGTQHRHPKRPAQPGVSHGSGGRAGAGALSRLPEAGDATEVGGEGVRAPEACRVADGGDDAGRRLRPDTVDGGDELADLMSVEKVLDVAFDGGEAA